MEEFASVNPSGTYDDAASLALNATKAYATAAYSFLPQQEIGGCVKLEAGFASATKIAELTVQLAAAAGTNGECA